MHRFMIEAGVSLECRACKKRTTFPALKVAPGIKCSHCGEMVEVDAEAIAAKTVMLAMAATMADVSVE